MFTGLIEQVGEIESVRQTDAGRELRVRASFTDLVNGESVALNGACLTIRDFGAGWFNVAAVATTLERTTVGSWKKGSRVNLERALRASDRLGGHIVQGHVDFVARVAGVEKRADAVLIDVALPTGADPLFVLHGSLAVDGVSLTVNDLRPGSLQLSLIEYTLRHTTLADLAAGSRVNVEADIVAKHVRRLLEPYLREASGVNSLTDYSLEH
jgi:riboflavin synthase